MDSETIRVDEELDLREYLNVLLDRWWLVAGATAAALIAALIFSLISPAVYRGSATVVVDRAGTSFGLISDITGISQVTLVDTLTEIVKSRSVAEAALGRLGIPSGAREEAIQRLQIGLRVRRVRGADLIRIEAEGPTPQTAAAVTNAIAEAFVAWHIDARRAQAAAGREFMEAQLATVGRELRAAEDGLARYKAQGGQIALSEQTTLVVEKLADFEAQRRAAAAERQTIEASLVQAQKALSQNAPTVSSSFVTSEDPAAAPFRQQLASLEVELAGLREQFTDRNAQVIAARAKIAEAKVRLQRLAAQRLASQTVTLNPLHQDLAAQVIRLGVERQALRARESALAGVVRRYARDVQQLPAREVTLARLTRDVKVAEQTYLLLSQKLQEARIAEASIVGDLRIVDNAVPPKVPVKPRIVLNTLLGLLLGLMAGVGAVFVVESLDTAVKGPDEAAELLNLAVLATIPLWREASKPPKDLMVPFAANQRRSPFAESFRHLRTGLLYSSPDRPLRTILVTSPGPGEGKSTIAANLAVTLAAADRKVCLVECDLRQPSLILTFQPKTQFGLTDLLVDGLSMDQVVQRTVVENLWFLPGGTQPPNPAELLGSKKMRDFLRHDWDGAEMFVLDGPPVLAVTDSEVLASNVDGVVLVVRLGTTPRDAARRAYERLIAVGARVVGVVVNGVPHKRRGGYYGYYSYYDDSEEASSPVTTGIHS